MEYEDQKSNMILKPKKCFLSVGVKENGYFLSCFWQLKTYEFFIEISKACAIRFVAQAML